MKRALKWMAVVLVVIGSVLGLGFLAFGRTLPIVNGQELARGVETVKDSFVSVFVLDVAPGKVALIDAGNDKTGKALLAALEHRGLSPSSVVAIFLTHGHPDHTAGCRLFPGADVYAMAEDVALVGDAAKVTHALKDGDVTDIGALHVEAFATPGHTPGSAVYFANGVLFFGDSAGGGKDGTVLPAVRFFSKDPGQNEASLKALALRLQPRAAEVKTLAFAHSGPLDGFGPLAAFASSH